MGPSVHQVPGVHLGLGFHLEPDVDGRGEACCVLEMWGSTWGLMSTLGLVFTYGLGIHPELKCTLGA